MRVRHVLATALVALTVTASAWMDADANAAARDPHGRNPVPGIQTLTVSRTAASAAGPLPVSGDAADTPTPAHRALAAATPATSSPSSASPSPGSARSTRSSGGKVLIAVLLFGGLFALTRRIRNQGRRRRPD